MIATDNQLRFKAKDAGQAYHVTGFTTYPDIAYAIDDRGNLMQLASQVTGNARDGYDITVPSLGIDAQYFVGISTSLPTPVISPSVDAETTPQSLLPTGDNNFVVITHPYFVDRFSQPGDKSDFVAARTADGFEVVVVTTDDIYAHFGDGMQTANAITNYIKAANDAGESLHVLLVGAATSDPAGYLAANDGSNSINFVPTQYGWTRFSLDTRTASDSILADLDGDGVQDVPIGRWPVFDQDELDTIIDKTLNYVDTGHNLSQSVQLIADRDDVAQSLSFRSQIERLSGSFLHYENPGPNAIDGVAWQDQRTLIYDDFVAAANDDVSTARRNVREQLGKSFDVGMSVSVFAGHGSPTNWSRSNMLHYRSAGSVTGRAANSTMLFSLSCYNSVFNEPTTKTLGHRMLFGEDGARTGGAVALMGSISLSSYFMNETVSQQVLSGMLQQGMTIGEAIIAAKQQFGVDLPNVQIGWQLNGDPSLKLTAD